MTPTTRPARVCVFALRTCGAGDAGKSKTPYGAGLSARGRVRRTRQDRLPTTTNYTLGLVSSSKGRVCYANIHSSWEGVNA